MGISRRCRILVAILVALTFFEASSFAADGDLALGLEERRSLERGLNELTARLRALRARETPGRPGDHLADAEVFAKGATWALEYDSTFSTADLALLKQAIEAGGRRASDLEAGEAPWAGRTGKVVRGFVSAVDGSVQPYAVVVPSKYDRSRPIRLDVVLHGSSKPVGMSELRFMGRFDEGEVPAADDAGRDFIELHPLGRVENGYRWAGEADVFEAIEATCRNYAVDRSRIVLRGMSMGASGAWHLGLKNPDRFVALGPYCGYVDTHEFSRTPGVGFVPVDALPADQEAMLHMLDSVDYAANALMVPSIACIGEKDVFFQAHEIMGRAMAKEGLEMVNLISPGTGHVIDPVTHAEQMRRIAGFAAKGRNPAPEHVRFVTWTLKYSRCDWVQVLGLGQHYTRAELEGRFDPATGSVEMQEPRNIDRFAILPPVADTLKVIRVGGLDVPIPENRGDSARTGFALGKEEGRWSYLGGLDRLAPLGKRPGVQGPIDDAFTAPFLCVRGTGKAWDPAVQAWAEANLRRFSAEWKQYFRGQLPIKDDTAVTEADARRFNLILFGDPGSNAWIERLLPQLPVRWNREECAIGGTSVASAGHAPVFIQPNPLASGRYVVLNSGHTFRERELSTLNYLLYSRLADWAVVKIAGKAEGGAIGEEVIRGGFFDERWAAPR